MNNFKFGNPWLLFIFLPLVIALVIGFFLMKKEKRYTKKNITSFCLHIAVALLVSFAFADPQFLKIGRETEVYILVDASASEKTSVDRLNDAVNNTRSEALKVPNTKVGIIAFANGAKTVADLGDSFDGLETLYEDSSFDYSATDIEQALLYTAEKFSGDAFKRIVLISDGEETDGEAIDAMETLLEQGITIDAIDLQADFPAEVSLTGIKYTDNVYLNRQEEVEASISASTPTDATIELYKDDDLIESKNSHLGNGINIVNFSLDTSISGEFDYRLEVKAQDNLEFKDTFTENNVRSFVQNVNGDFNILFIGTVQSQLDKFTQMAELSEETTIDSYIGTDKVPYALEDLINYDEIILSNIDVVELDHYDEFIDNLTTAVSVYGKSVFTFDSTHVGNTNDPSLVKYNDLLPVQYQPDDSRALVLVIDSSGSMGGNNINMAIQGAKEVVDKLDINDSIAVVTFETNVNIPVTMTTIRNEANRQDIKDKIDKITVNGGTNMMNGLDEAYKQIEGVTAEYKDIITLSDGIAGDNEEDLKDYVTSMSFSNISCSFINIGDKGGEELLKTLAKLGNGQYHYVDSALGLKDIMVDTIEQEIIDTVIEKDSEIIYQMKDDATLQGGVYNNLENISGYNYCRMKSGANTVLSVQYIHTNSENQLNVIAVPLYAYWDFGQGKVSSFTSSLDTDWTNKFWNSAAGQTFFKNILSQSFPERFNKSILDVDFTANGSTTDVTVTPHVDTDETKVEMEVKPYGTENASTYSLVYDGENFNTQIATPQIGLYEATISFSRLNSKTDEYELVESTDIIFSFDFSSEFNFFDTKDNTLLYQLSSQSGGSLLPEDEIHLNINDSQLSDASYQSTMVWFLLAAVIVYLIDIAIRRTIFKKKPKQQNIETPSNYF